MIFYLIANPAHSYVTVTGVTMIATSPFQEVFPKREVNAKNVKELESLLEQFINDVREAFRGGFEARVYCPRTQRKPKGFDAARTRLKRFVEPV